MYGLLLGLHTDQIYNSKWSLKVKSILDNGGLSNIWIDQGSKMDKNYVQTAVGRGIDHIATQTWLRDVSTHKQCSNYKIFKHEKCLETYLLKLNFSDMTKVCQFRCGNHKLPIASGRFLDTQPPPPPPTLCHTIYSLGTRISIILVCVLILLNVV